MSCRQWEKVREVPGRLGAGGVAGDCEEMVGNRREWEYLRYYPIEAGTVKIEAERENK